MITNGGGALIRAFLVALALTCVYLMPTLIAALRGAPTIASIAVINLLLGWTMVGWVAALAMAVWPIRLEQNDHE
jgi:Superinfection immunity protein